MIAGTVSGCVGQDAKLGRTGDAGDAVLNFSVASNGRVKGEDEVTWVRVAIWGKRATALAPYITKGTRVCCTGLLSVRTFESNKTGETKVSVELNAHHIDLLGGGKKDEARQESKPLAKAGERNSFGGNNGADDEEDPF